MRDDTASEEELLSELDSMYQRVADLETKELVAQKRDVRFRKAVQGKVIPFPEKMAGVPMPAGEPANAVSGEKPAGKSPYFMYMVVIFLSVFFWACVFWIGSFYKTYSALGSLPDRTGTVHAGSGDTIQKTVVPALPSPNGSNK